MRWFGQDTAHQSGFQADWLPRIGFVPSEDIDTFKFIDPDYVLRTAHLIPAFAHNKINELLAEQSIARQSIKEDKNWQYYYVNRWVLDLSGCIMWKIDLASVLQTGICTCAFVAEVLDTKHSSETSN